MTFLPPKLLAARELAILTQDVEGELWWFIFALSILHGTFHDPSAPVDYVPSFRVAVPPLRHAAGLEVDAEALMDAAADDVRGIVAQLMKPPPKPVPKDQLN